MNRKAEISRKTAETDIKLSINIDGNGNSSINTGIGFLDHMLVLFSKHGFLDLSIECKGDLRVDSHHTIEDVGIVLGQAINKALGEKQSINRYGSSMVPMDETLVSVAMDISNRPYLVSNLSFSVEILGDLQTEMFEEFFRAVAFNAGITLHINLINGNNNHHIAEAAFKAFGRALDQATAIDNRISGVMSTKGVL